jgi:TonB family protein
VIICDKEYKYGQVWNRDGDKVLENGNGSNSHLSDDKSETYYEYYQDSLLVMQYGIRNIEKDTIHYTVDRMAAPKEGFQRFLQNLVNILKYPGIARLAGKEGVIYVQFIVDKNGELTDFKPLSNEGYNFEQKAIKKMEKLPSWNPGIYKNNVVKQKFVLPVKFKLI